jgi:hypothetical protein
MFRAFTNSMMNFFSKKNKNKNTVGSRLAFEPRMKDICAFRHCNIHMLGHFGSS